MRASISLMVSFVRATSPSNRTNAAMPSTAAENSGTTNPPRPSPANTTSGAAAAADSPVAAVTVQTRSTPSNAGTCRATRGGLRTGPEEVDAVDRGHLLGDPRRRHRQRDPAAVTFRCDEVHDDEQCAVVMDDLAPLVDPREPFGDRVEPRAERGAGRRDELAETGEPLHVRGERLRR